MKRKFTLLILPVFFLCWVGWPVKGQANPPDLEKKESVSDSETAENRLQNTVEGLVVDQNGEPLIGVNVLVKGTSTGTSTDFDGRFELDDVDEDAVLVRSEERRVGKECRWRSAR